MAILSETSRTLNPNREIVIYKLLNDEAAANTTSTAVDVLDSDELMLVVESSTGVASGVVTLEGAMTSDYAGTWASLGTATTNAASKTFLNCVVSTNGATGLPVPFVRARISTIIGSGTVDAYLIKRR
jgi:hypothetical protein